MYDKYAARRAVLTRLPKFATPSDLKKKEKKEKEVSETRKRFAERIAHIEELLGEGKNYREIGDKLGLTRQRIEQIVIKSLPHLRRVGLNVTRGPMVERVCATCGTKFQARERTTTKYCDYFCWRARPLLSPEEKRRRFNEYQRTRRFLSPEAKEKHRALMKARYERVKHTEHYKQMQRKHSQAHYARKKEKKRLENEALRAKLIKYGVIKD